MKTYLKNILTVLIILVTALVTHSAVATELSPFQVSARCSVWAHVSGNAELRNQHQTFAKIGIEDRSMYWQGGYASAVLQQVVKDTGLQHKAAAKQLYKVVGCSKYIPKNT